MEKVLTAKELFDKMLTENDEVTSTEMMIEFAKLHVESALKGVSEKKTQGMLVVPLFNEEQIKEILNSYPLENIK
jgi:hypothetical protein